MNNDREAYSVIEGDMLVRCLPVRDDPLLWKKEVILTKEEFVLCFREWIVKGCNV